MTPLIGAICGCHEDLALHLLALPAQDLDLNRCVDIDKTDLHLCVESGLTRLVKELVRRGADFFLWDDMHHSPLRTAAMHAHLPLVRFLLKQYKARGESELERALYYPCGKKGFEYSLLGHVSEGFGNLNSLRHVATDCYLVQERRADLWKPLKVHSYGTDAGKGALPILDLPLHDAAWHGSGELLAFFIEECDMLVDRITTCLEMAPLHSLCMSRRDEAEVLRIVRFLVEQKGANLSLKTIYGETATQLVLRQGKRQIYEFLARKESEEAARQASVRNCAESRLTELVRASEGATEEETESVKKQAKQGKKRKAKGK